MEAFNTYNGSLRKRWLEQIGSQSGDNGQSDLCYTLVNAR